MSNILNLNKIATESPKNTLSPRYPEEDNDEIDNKNIENSPTKKMLSEINSDHFPKYQVLKQNSIKSKPMVFETNDIVTEATEDNETGI